MKSLLSLASCQLIALGFLVATTATGDVPLGLNTATRPHVPIDQRTSPGVYGRYMTAGRAVRPQLQAVRVVTPAKAEVTVYGASQPGGLTVTSDDVVGIEVGPVYRLKVENIEGLPGVAVYPSIELVDRLHPPEGHAAEFPIQIEITAEEIEAALTDRLVTKVVYLRHRNAVAATDERTTLPTADIDGGSNVVEAAIERGRPIAVLRLGGRTPAGPTDAEFFVGGSIEYPLDR